MKVGLYFGSFNPIHVGHLIIGSFVANNTELEQVWFIVSPQNPLKKASGLLNEYDRLHLARLAIEGDPQLRLSDIEFKLPKPSFTIDTLTYLQEKYTSNIFSIIVGSDSLQNISKWKNSEILLKNFSLYVYERPGFPLTRKDKNIYSLKAPLLNISSTNIRSLITNNKSVRYLVPEKVREEIEKNGYYKKKL